MRTSHKKSSIAAKFFLDVAEAVIFAQISYLLYRESSFVFIIKFIAKAIPDSSCKVEKGNIRLDENHMSAIFDKLAAFFKSGIKAFCHVMKHPDK